jgi:hypothetical protein
MEKAADRTLAERHLAKVGVEGSNPFARSRLFQENQKLNNGPSGPFFAYIGQARCAVSSL